MRTKWEIVQARLEAARKEVEVLEHQIGSMENTPCGANACSCGATFKTEADFAKHFILPDERFLNLGWCPITDRGQAMRQQFTLKEEIRWV
jgi:hypothetical protein